MKVQGSARAPSRDNSSSGFSLKNIAQKVTSAAGKVVDAVKSTVTKLQEQLQKDTFEKGPLAPHVKNFLENKMNANQATEGGGDVKPAPADQGTGTKCVPDLPCNPDQQPVMAHDLLYRPGETEVHINQIGTIKRPENPILNKGIPKTTIA